MAEEQLYRACLYCRTEIASGRPNHTNFCNDICQKKFRSGLDPVKYKEDCDLNKLAPIRGAKEAPAERRAKRKLDNIHHRLCKLGEFKDEVGWPLCSVQFPTTHPNKWFCVEEHQVQYNTLKATQRARERRRKQ